MEEIFQEALQCISSFNERPFICFNLSQKPNAKLFLTAADLRSSDSGTNPLDPRELASLTGEKLEMEMEIEQKIQKVQRLFEQVKPKEIEIEIQKMTRQIEEIQRETQSKITEFFNELTISVNDIMENMWKNPSFGSLNLNQIEKDGTFLTKTIKKLKKMVKGKTKENSLEIQNEMEAFFNVLLDSKWTKTQETAAKRLENLSRRMEKLPNREISLSYLRIQSSVEGLERMITETIERVSQEAKEYLAHESHFWVSGYPIITTAKKTTTSEFIPLHSGSFNDWMLVWEETPCF